MWRTVRTYSTTFVQCSGENDVTWWYRTLSFFMTMQGVAPLLLSRKSCDACNGRFWNIHHSNPMSPCDYDLFAKVKEPLRGNRSNTGDELFRAIGRSVKNINKDGLADSVRRLPNIWQKVINMGATILKIHKYCTLVNKVMTEISNCCHYFLSNPCILAGNFTYSFEQ